MGTAVLPDHDTIAVYGQNLEVVYLYSLSKGTEVGEWKTGKGITNIIVSSSGKRYTACGWTKQYCTSIQ
ncbi:hypothetical protein GCM10020331_072910 [Ectobacillus funiculus]